MTWRRRNPIGVGAGSDANIGTAIGTALAFAAIVISSTASRSAAWLNPLIVTLAVGLIVIGLVNRYGRTFPVQNLVPEGWSDWVATRVVGVSAVFWIGLGLDRRQRRAPVHGHRPPVPGGRRQPGHARRHGRQVSLNQIMVYVVAAVLYAVAGLALAGRIGRPGVYVGSNTS